MNSQCILEYMREASIYKLRDRLVVVPPVPETDIITKSITLLSYILNILMKFSYLAAPLRSSATLVAYESIRDLVNVSQQPRFMVYLQSMSFR